jgi:superfamily II DNA or RNA helicase
MDQFEATAAEGNQPRRRTNQNGARPMPAAPRLRPYQVEAQQAILEHRARGIRSQIVSLATGLGKTVVLATLPKLLSLRPGDVTLVVAHRDELIEQTVEKMQIENPGLKIGVEKAERKAPDDSNIIVATVQTLSEKRLEAFVQRFHRRISLFIIDEAHHAAAPSYRAIVDAILAQRPEAMVLGFTATPNRGDGVRLVDVFEKIVYSMDARKAIDAGYLVPVKSYAVATTTNLDDIASRGGDFVIGQLAAAVNTVDRNARIVAAYKQHTAGMKALVFTASVEHARDIAEEFVANGVKAEWASGETPKDEREKIVRDFRNGDIDVLANCGLYLEGFDVPSVQVILNARPTKSTTLYTQITGRALRPVDDRVRADAPRADRKKREARRLDHRLRRSGATPSTRHAALALRLTAADRRARPDDGASSRKIRRAAAAGSQTRRQGAHRRRDRDRAARDRRIRGAEGDQADVGAARPRSLADDSPAAADRVGQVGPPDSEFRATMGSVGDRSTAHRAA